MRARAVALGAAAVARGGKHAEAEAAARAAMDAFMAAFNARDVAAWRASLHFPRVRIAGGAVRVWQKPED